MEIKNNIETRFENICKIGYKSLLKIAPNFEKDIQFSLQKNRTFIGEEFTIEYQLIENENNTILMVLNNSLGIQPALEFEIEIDIINKKITTVQRTWNNYTRVDFTSEEEFDEDNEENDLYFYMTKSLVLWLESLEDEKIVIE